MDFSKLNRNMLEIYDNNQENLRKLRLFLNISLKKVSKDLNVAYESMSKYENGKRNVPNKKLFTILSYYSKEFDKGDFHIEQELTIEQAIKNMNLIKDDGLTEKGKKMLNILKSFE